ncbi:multidrug resistance efflux transporter family protein [Paenibacillus oralis]|uniref:Multidrug resistance efflux transporter family protein n=1 Tax=Paenibacillus oralis TaxID=2490856 RepID=A0A3P3U771_9BACL|nr:multidrug resistance efflux transporter family protein [Paenibacillus oralis]RRJ66221.1 multidrug resistance efflux transporter family protein [Paenibacillus oralis]
MRPILYGILASLFFSSTFVLNQTMKWSGGNWMYAASLRFLFMIPFLLVIVGVRGRLAPLFAEMRKRPWTWLGWSFVGFGIMYVPVCFAAEYEPGWLIAGTWQITIVAGLLVAPAFSVMVDTPAGPVRRRGKVHWRGLGISLIILVGVGMMQLSQAQAISARELLLGAVPVVVAAFAYPLGNRKMMAVCGGRLDAYQRVLGMALATLPLWLLLSAAAFWQDGPPSSSQAGQALLVAVCSGVIATVLFFAATDMARGSARKLAAVEATQSGEVVFATVGELLLLPVPLPALPSLLGMLLVVAGMILHSWASGSKRSPALPDKESGPVVSP